MNKFITPAFPVVMAILLSSCMSSGKKAVNLKSPGQTSQINIRLDDQGQLLYNVDYNASTVIHDSKLGLNLEDGGYLGDSLTMVSEAPYSLDTTYAVIAGKSDSARNHFNGIRLSFKETKGKGRTFILDLRAYDDGVAFRYEVPKQDMMRSYSLIEEKTHFSVDTALTAWPIQFNSFKNNYEEHYLPVKVGEITKETLVGEPFVFTGSNFTAAITEAELAHYAGMYLHRSENDSASLSVVLPPNPEHPSVKVYSLSGLKTPWRVVMFSPDEVGLIASNLILNLNEPDAIKDPSWIRPGKVAWDWWNGEVVKGKGFKGKMDNRTMEYFIDFASEAGLRYMLIDAGWYGNYRDPNSDITTCIPEINMEQLVAYGLKRNVDIMVWVHWKSLERQLNDALTLYQEWGVKGIKVDYMDSDAQPMVDYYHKVVEAAADHKLLVDFHGAYKPTGLRRTYPNLMTREGVMGMEYLKWSSKADPEHNVTIPFTRMLAGPMDYTPGGFNQVVRSEFDSASVEPKTLGTRCQQLAMYVVYESPLQMVSDHPAAYKGQKGFEFIKMVPTTWDQTIGVDGKISDYIIVARRKGADWYVGGMTDWTPRTLTFKTSFLEQGKAFHAVIFKDADDSDIHPKDLVQEEKTVNGGDEMTFSLAPGGGFAIQFTPVKE